MQPDSPVVFFVGAGMSKPLGLPTWNELLHGAIDHGRLIGRLTERDARTALSLMGSVDYLGCGDFLRDRLGARLDTYLREVFDTPLPSDLGAYEYLVRLPSRGFVTTNYDHAIELAYSKHYRRPLRPLMPDDFASLATAGQRQPFLIKLHGDATRGRFILGRSDYALISDSAPFQRFLYSLFFSHTIVFLGYGLSDSDLLIPLKLLAQDYGGSGRRHLAVLPSTITRPERTRLEDEYAIDIVVYDKEADGHGAVGRLTVDWFVTTNQRIGTANLEDTPVDYAEVLQISPRLLIPQQRAACVRGVEWLLACPSRWGPTPEGPLRVANAAEALLALSTVRDTPDLPDIEDPLTELNDLLAMQDSDTGGFQSILIRTTSPHPHALAMIALARWADRIANTQSALKSATRWLLSNLDETKGGWLRYDRDADVAIVPTVWGYAALLHVGAFRREAWGIFRDRLLASHALGHVFTRPSKSMAAAGWILWLTHLLRQHLDLSEPDLVLVRTALQQLEDPRLSLASEAEMVAFTDDTDYRGLRAWLHPTAEAVAVGALQWSDTYEESFTVAGRAIANVLQHAQAGASGQFCDLTMGSQSVDLVFPTAYGVWSLAEALKRFPHVGTIRRLGAIVIENDRLLLIRKRGRQALTIPTADLGTPVDQAIRRAMQATLGVTVVSVEPWRTFEDRAAFEPNARVRLETVFCRIEGTPEALGGDGEIVWYDIALEEDVILSPILMDHVLPALRLRISGKL
jgi:hypothetical protein